MDRRAMREFCRLFDKRANALHDGSITVTGKDKKRFLFLRQKLAKQWLRENPLRLVRPSPEKKTSDENFYWSDAWRKLRYEVLKEQGRRCHVCGRTPDDGVKVNVDHIKPRSKHPRLALKKSNLQVMCEDCNLGKRNRDEIDWRNQS